MFIVVLIFGVALSAVIGLTIWYKFQEKTASMAIFNNTAIQNITNKVNTGYTAVDNMFPLLFLGGNLAAIFLSFMVRAHPIFLVFSIVVILLMLVLAAVFSNAYYQIGSADAMVNYSAQFPMTNTVMNNLVLFQMVFCFIDAIVLYSSIGRSDASGA
jgi:hypothetical protein